MGRPSELYGRETPPGSWPPPPRGPKKAWWLVPLLVVVAAIVVAVIVIGDEENVAGRPTTPDGHATSSASSSASPTSALPSYQPFPDGSGYSTEPMDQPYPFPDFFWPGARDVCEWITPELARQGGGTGEINPQEAGCSVLMGGNEVVQVSSIGTYAWVTDQTRFIRPVTIAGLQAREYAFTGMGAGECALHVNTRAPTMLNLVAWNPRDRDGGSVEQRCQVARGVAEVLVGRYVPLAGGTPWERTPQRPGASAGAGKVACEIVDQSAAVSGNTDPRRAATGTDPLGTTCTYEGEGVKLIGLVAEGPDTGLADVEPRLPDAEVSDRRLGELPARQEDAGTTCALSVEFLPSRIFTITYEVNALGLACKNAEVVAAQVLTRLIDASTS